MAISGNDKLESFFEEYDMNIKCNIERYSSKASEYYRSQLKSCIKIEKCEEILFDHTKPDYEIGREQMIVQRARSGSEIMKNNGQFCSKPLQKKKSAIKTGWSYVSWGAKQLKDKVKSRNEGDSMSKTFDEKDISEEIINDGLKLAEPTVLINMTKITRQSVKPPKFYNQTQTSTISTFL